MITLTCDKCDKLFEIDDDAAGEKVACPYCGDINRVPHAGSPPTVPTTPTIRTAPAGAVAVGSPAMPGTVAGVAGATRQPVTAAEPERTLAVVRQAMFRAHPFWYLLMVAVFFGGIAMMVLAQPNQPWGNAHWLVWAGVFLTGVAILWWLGWWAAPSRWVRLKITNKRVIRIQGIFGRQSNELRHRDISDISVKQSFLQRILDVGYLGIDSAGQGGQIEDKPGHEERRNEIEIEMENVPRPNRVKEMINEFRL